MGRNQVIVHRLIAGFDGLVALLFVSLFVGNVREAHFPHSDAAPDITLISLTDCVLDGFALVSALGAAICLLSRSRQGQTWQRAVFWSLLLRTVFLFGEGLLPGAGFGGFLLLVSGVFFLMLVVVAFCAANYLRPTGRGAAVK